MKRQVNRMMAITVLAIVFMSAIAINASAQTLDIERVSLASRQVNKEITPEKFLRYGAEWKKIIASVGGYPTMPYDEKSGQIKFKMVHHTGVSKEVNYDRILEWAALKFGALSSVLHYDNLESGKIIIKGWFSITHKADYKNFWGVLKESINTTKCYQTYVFTVKDNDIKVEIRGINYVFKSTAYSGVITYEQSIDEFYPITQYESEEWKSKLEVLKETNSRIKGLFEDVSNYIMDYESDYNF